MVVESPGMSIRSMIQDMDVTELKQYTQKVMSLPCTVVKSASGTRELLDLTCAHRFKPLRAMA
jgi:hypothetical protein